MFELSTAPTCRGCRADGWLKGKFGVSWQIVPTVLGKLLSDPDPVKSGRVMHAMLQMINIDIGALQRAYDGA